MSETTTLCSSCRSPKGNYECGSCKQRVCKNCVEKIAENSFSFLEKIPEDLRHRLYCAACYVARVAPALGDYESTLARAKRVTVFLKRQSETTRFVRRSEKPLKVADCADHAEALLRLAFFAAQSNFNTLVDVEIKATKVRNFGYQKNRWEGLAIPVHLDRELPETY